MLSKGRLCSGAGLFFAAENLWKTKKQSCAVTAESIRRHLKKGIPLCVYNNEVRDSLAAIKYQNQKEYADFYIMEIKRGN